MGDLSLRKMGDTDFTLWDSCSTTYLTLACVNTFKQNSWLPTVSQFSPCCCHQPSGESPWSIAWCRQYSTESPETVPVYPAVSQTLACQEGDLKGFALPWHWLLHISSFRVHHTIFLSSASVEFNHRFTSQGWWGGVPPAKARYAPYGHNRIHFGGRGARGF